MTKTSIRAEVKGMWNSTKTVEGVNLARVNFRTNQWMIIGENDSFDDAAERDFQAVARFETQEELVSEVYAQLA